MSEQTEIEALRAENAALRETVRRLEGRLAALERTTRSVLEWVKPNWPAQSERQGAARKTRAAEQNAGRRRSRPTRIVRHAYDACPDCGYVLRGEAIARRREVLELPTAGIEVVEHQMLTRRCPVCCVPKTPRVSFAGVTLGQSRIGVRLASLSGTLRTVGRLPLAQIQAHLGQA